MNDKKYYVYIATNERNTVFYVGVTNNVDRRLFEHKAGADGKSFTKRYGVKKLVYAEKFSTAMEAIGAEKKLKGWTRKKKMELIWKSNPRLIDLLA